MAPETAGGTDATIDPARAIKDFLTTRRAKITPQRVGLPSAGRRRVPGLRREEVALLAGVSAEYYVQIERGQVGGVSEEVLGAVARALELDDVETAHLHDLVGAASGRPVRRRRTGASRTVPDGVRALLDALVGAPAIVQNGRLDLLATNALAAALYAPALEDPEPNLARFVFLDDRAEEIFPAWERAADDVVALLQVEAARNPDTAATTSLVGTLATRSEEFRVRWARHDVRAHRHGVKRFRHPLVGELSLRFEGLEPAGAPGLTMIGYTPEPASVSEEALRLLASWVTDPAPVERSP
ncbi:helix-turn-helix domain-containing protein [Pseudonocardia phyllosphaerae]|uniref:helix-turn-helix domain-containing protein n=1 Tax=Pseudonocardia phyllosphaerae TaxID=3390502 RepID=UPI00397A9493